MTAQLCEELHSYGILAFVVISVIVARYRRRRTPLILYVSNTLLYGLFYLKKCGHLESEHGKYRSEIEEYRDRDHNDVNFDFVRDKNRLKNSAQNALNNIHSNIKDFNFDPRSMGGFGPDPTADDPDYSIDKDHDKPSSSRPFMSFASYDDLQDFISQKLSSQKDQHELVLEQVKESEQRRLESRLEEYERMHNDDLERIQRLQEEQEQQQKQRAPSNSNKIKTPASAVTYIDDDSLVNSHTPRSYLKLHNDFVKQQFTENKLAVSQAIPNWEKIRNNLEFKDLQENIQPGLEVSRLLKDHRRTKSLKEYEIRELRSGKYNEVWFTGSEKIQKIKWNSSALNNGFDIEENEDGSRGGSYRIVDGDHINFRYEIIKYISAGVYGQVLLVKDHAQDLNMALKVMNNHTSLKSRLGLEYYAVRYIHRHILPEERPFVVGAHGVDTFRNHQIFVYELLGESVWARHHRQKVRGDLLKKITWDLLEGLAVLDRIELVHNDLKPDNILFTGEEYPYVKIIDYG